MILFLQYPGMDRQWFKIMDFEDLNPIFASFPMTRDIAMSSDTLREAVENISEYLSSHSLSSWIEDKDLNKSLRSKAVALGLSLTAALGSDGHQLRSPEMKPTPPPGQEAAQQKSDFGKHPLDHFLWNIQQIESSGGANTNHKPIASGKFKGTKAIGKWGLLKPTVDEMVGRMRMNGSLKPEHQKLELMSRDKMEDYFKQNPQVELDMARKVAEHVMNRQHNNQHRSAYAWLHGHNLHPADIPNDKLMMSDYVSKYKQLDKMNPYTPKRKPAGIKKAQPQPDDEDFKMRVRNWYKRRENEITDEPTRSSNFQPDPGRKRDDDLDQITPDSMKTHMQVLKENIKRVNDKP